MMKGESSKRQFLYYFSSSLPSLLLLLIIHWDKTPFLSNALLRFTVYSCVGKVLPNALIIQLIIHHLQLKTVKFAEFYLVLRKMWLFITDFRRIVVLTGVTRFIHQWSREEIYNI